MAEEFNHSFEQTEQRTEDPLKKEKREYTDLIKQPNTKTFLFKMIRLYEKAQQVEAQNPNIQHGVCVFDQLTPSIKLYLQNRKYRKEACGVYEAIFASDQVVQGVKTESLASGDERGQVRTVTGNAFARFFEQQC